MVKQPDLITTREVSKLLEMSIAHVNKCAAAGQLKTALKLPGRTGSHLFDRAYIESIRTQGNEATHSGAKS